MEYFNHYLKHFENYELLISTNSKVVVLSSHASTFAANDGSLSSQFELVELFPNLVKDTPTSNLVNYALFL